MWGEWLRRASAFSVLLGLAGFVLCGGEEAWLTAWAGADLRSIAAAGVATGAFAWAFGVLFAALFATLTLLEERMESRARVPLLFVLTLSCALFFTLRTAAPSERVNPLPYVLMAFATAFALALASAAAVARSPRFSRWVALALTLPVFVLDHLLGNDVYPEAHEYAWLVFMSGLACGVVAPALRLSMRRHVPAFAALGLAMALSAASATQLVHPPFRTWALIYGRGYARLSTWVQRPFDFDGDGHAAWLGGGDCDDGDPARFPGAWDPPGDGDQNCNGVDAADFAANRESAGAYTGLVGGPVERVLLLSIDAFRPELVEPRVMPNLARFFATGHLFTRAYAASSSTQGSVPLFHRPTRRATSLVTYLRKHHLATEAVGASFDTDDFERTSYPLSDAERLARAETWLRGEGRGYLWTHLSGLHDPYVLWPEAMDPPALSTFAPAYVSEAVHLDRLLAPLLAAYAARAHDTLLIITGDHAEAFHEHGIDGHARLAWEEIIRTPLVLFGAGIRGRVDGRLVSHRDLPATILAAFGYDAEARLHERFGRSLTRYIAEPERAFERYVVVHSTRTVSGALGRGPLAALIDSRYKLVRGVVDGATELYDLRADPGERTNIAARKPELVERMVGELSRYLDAEGYPSAAPVSLHRL